MDFSFFGTDDGSSKATVSLRDPIGLTRIKTPCRTANCNHWQAFDLFVHVERLKKIHTTQWTCPVCGECAHPNRIKLDNWFDGVLKTCDDDAHLAEFDTSTGLVLRGMSSRAAGKRKAAQYDVDEPQAKGQKNDPIDVD